MEKEVLSIKIKLGRLYEFLEPFILEIEKISSGYPASKEHHHQDQQGLFIHSLEVADKMLEIFEKDKDRYLPRYQDEKTGEYQTRYEKMLFHVALTGLLHDIGKIGAYEIKSSWYYIPFITSVPEKDYELMGNKGVNYINSNHLAGMAFGILLERAGKKYYESFLYDFKYITIMLEAISLEHYKVLIDNPIMQILKKADGMSVAEATGEAFFEAKQEAGIKEIDLAKAYVDFLKQWIKISTNYYFYTREHILVVNPSLHQGLVKQINESIGEAISEDIIIDELIEKGYTDERITKKSIKLPSGKTTNFSVLKLFADKVFSQEELEATKKKLKVVSIETENINEIEL